MGGYIDNYKVYAHIHKESGKVYIGITKQEVERRWRNGLGYKVGKFRNAVNKYGWDAFSHIVIMDHLSHDMANIVEKELIKKYRTNERKYGYNLTSGGDNEYTGQPMPEHVKRRLREVNVGRKLSEDSKHKISIANKGKTIPEDQRKRISNTLRILWQDEDYRNHMIQHMVNKSEDTKRKISESHKGKKWTEQQRIRFNETIERNRKSNKVNGNSIPVVQLDRDGVFIMEFSSARLAEDITGVKNPSISNACRGKLKTAGGFKWMYKDDYIKLIGGRCDACETC